jgi:hypothetical protein
VSELFFRTRWHYKATSGEYTTKGCDAIVVPMLGTPLGEASRNDYERFIEVM